MQRCLIVHRNFLTSVRGLGLKSVECIRLLTLHHPSFPVRKNPSLVIHLHDMNKIWVRDIYVHCYLDREFSLCTPFCEKLETGCFD
jgi:hypothetical protein